MRITIEMMGPLRGLQSEGQSTVMLELRPDSTVADALRAVGMPDDEPWIASIAGQLVYAEHLLNEGDSLLVFAPIAGGC